MLKGSCLCGAVRFTVTGPVRDPGACHCGQCRKWSGHVWAAGIVDEGEIAIEGPVRWFRSSAEAERGFCPECGSSLFWHAIGSGRMDFALGAVDGPTGLRIERHIFTEWKGDYYDICAQEHPQAGE